MNHSVTKNDIARRSAAFHHGGYPSFEIGAKNLQFQFFILPASLLPNFVGFTYSLVATKKNRREPWQSAVFGMSEDIPLVFREFVAYFEVFHRWFTMACYDAAQAEMHLVNESKLIPSRQREYVIWRQDFFQRLCEFSRSHGQSEEVIAEYEKTSAYFFCLRNTLPN